MRFKMTVRLRYFHHNFVSLFCMQPYILLISFTFIQSTVYWIEASLLFYNILTRFQPDPGLMDPFCLSVRLSVRWHDNSLQTQPIDLKLSTHLNKLKLGVKFEDGQNRNKFYSCHGYLIETNVGSMGQKINFVRMS